MVQVWAPAQGTHIRSLETMTHSSFGLMRALKAPPLSRKAPPLSRSVVSHHVTHATHAAIRKEDSGVISHCEHNLSSRLSSLRALCVPTPGNTHKIPQGRRFKSGRTHHLTHTHKGSNSGARTSLHTQSLLRLGFKLRCPYHATTHNTTPSPDDEMTSSQFATSEDIKEAGHDVWERR